MPLLLDGGLATTLQRRGLAPFTPVDAWLDAHPDRIVDAHRAFVDAGAQVVFAGTFRLLPGLAPRWEERLQVAVRLARRAAGERALVYASVGPGADDAAYARLGDALGSAPVDGVVLETFVDPDACARALSALRPRVDVPVTACLCPRDDGRLWSGAPALPALRRLVSVGADAVGFNCGAGPTSIEAAVAACAPLDAPLWALPNAGDAPPDAVVASLRRLADRCDAVGGCCGVGPEVVARLASAPHAP